jgi:peptide/nickel transport system substrate-binding protein
MRPTGRRTRRSGTLIAAAVLAALALVPLASAQATEGSADEDVVLRIGTVADLITDNPWAISAGADWWVVTSQYDMLLQFDNEDLSAAPGLATGCEPNADSTEWTCTLREGLKWSDGEPLTSEDVKFTYEFVMNNKIPVYKSYFAADPTFETPDDRTLIWKTEEPSFAPDMPPWVYIVPEHVWAEYDGKDIQTIKRVPNTPPVVSGPFMLTEWNRGQSWTMEQNPEYWGPEPVVDRLDFRVYTNEESMVQALKNGEIDIADGLKPSLFQSLEGQEDITTHQIISDWWLNLAFNFGGQGPNADPLPALRDHDVREAIAMAIDKQEIAEKVYQGYANPGDTIVREASTFWRYDVPAEEEYPYDPEAANQLLDDAGYTDTDDDGVREDPATGEPLHMRIPASDETTGAVDAGRLIRGMLAEIGISAEILPSSDGKMGDYWATGNFDAYIWYWAGDPDPNYQLFVFTSEQCGAWSDGCWKNDEFDRLYLEQNQEMDRAARQELVHEAQRVAYEDIPGLVLAYPSWLTAYRSDRFGSWTPAPGENGYLLPNYNYNSLLTVAPVEGSTGGEDSGPGLSVAVWVVIGVVLVGGLILLVRPRRRDREEA